MPYKDSEKDNARRRTPEYRAQVRKRRKLKAPSGQSVSVPAGHRVRGYSTLRDQSGETTREWTKTEKDPIDPPKFPVVPPDWAVQSTSTALDAEGKAIVQWVRAEPKVVALHDRFVEAVGASLERYRGHADPVPAPVDRDEDLCAVYAFGDAHIGMLARGKETGGRNFDLKIAEQEFCDAQDLLIERAPNAKRAVFLNIGDFLHYEDDSQLTPAHKNKVDGDQRWRKVIEVAVTIQRRCLDRLLDKHEQVDVVEVPGNHDPKGAQVLALMMQLLYEREPRVRVLDNTNPFLYDRFGSNLFAYCHGEVKHEQLPSIIAADCGAGGVRGCESWWSECRHRVVFVGHRHHLKRNEYPGITLEMLRTLIAREAYSNKAGYRSEAAAIQVTYHVSKGERHRQQVFADEVRRAE